MRLWISCWLAIVLLGGCTYPQMVKDGKVDEAYLQRVAERTARERGIPIEEGIAHKLISEAQAREHFAVAAERDLSVDALAQTQKSLAAFGFLSKDLRLRSLLLDLHAEQGAAFYDPHTKTFYMVDREAPGGSVALASWALERDLYWEMAVAHELVHSLQDQRYGLIPFLGAVAANDDAALARRAVIEGDATWFGLLTVFRGQLDLDELEFDREQMLEAASGEAFERAPQILQESLVFPYLGGFRFIKRARSVGERVWERPPTSTEQVLHPTKYLASEEPITLTLGDRELPAGWEPVRENTLGEFALGVLLRSVAKLSEEESKTVSAGWGGDRYRVYEQSETGELALIWALRFDTEKDAREFWSSYRRAGGPPGKEIRVRRVGRLGVAVVSAPSKALLKLLWPLASKAS